MKHNNTRSKKRKNKQKTLFLTNYNRKNLFKLFIYLFNSGLLIEKDSEEMVRAMDAEETCRGISTGRAVSTG